MKPETEENKNADYKSKNVSCTSEICYQQHANNFLNNKLMGKLLIFKEIKKIDYADTFRFWFLCYN